MRRRPLSAAAVRCLLSAVLFGLSTPAASALAESVPSLTLAGLLYVGAAAAMVPRVVVAPPSRADVRAEARPIAIAVVVGGGVGPALLVAGLARTDAATASLLLNLELVATVAIAGVFFREHIGRRVVGGSVLVTVAGVVLVGEPGATVDAGAVLVVAACLCWGLDNVVTAGVERVAPEAVVLAKGVVAGSANLALGLATTGIPDIGIGEVAGALAVGAVGYGVSIRFWVEGARRLGAARAQVLFATAPFIGVLGAWIGLGEQVDGVTVAAFVVAAAGVAVSLDSGHSHEHAHGGLVHTHPHVPDLDHRHGHGSGGGIGSPDPPAPPP